MPNKNNFNDASLRLLLAGGSEYAFQVIFDRYRNRVYHVAMLYLKSPALSEEVVQDVFLKIWFQRKGINQVNSIDAWLYTIAKNVALNSLKKIVNERKAFEILGRYDKGAESNADFKILDRQNNELLNRAVNNLSFKQKEVFRLAREAGQSYEEIGKVLTMSPLTVKTHMARALDNIRTFLKKYGS